MPTRSNWLSFLTQFCPTATWLKAHATTPWSGMSDGHLIGVDGGPRSVAPKGTSGASSGNVEHAPGLVNGIPRLGTRRTASRAGALGLWQVWSPGTDHPHENRMMWGESCPESWRASPGLPGSNWKIAEYRESVSPASSEAPDTSGPRHQPLPASLCRIRTLPRGAQHSPRPVPRRGCRSASAPGKQRAGLREFAGLRLQSSPRRVPCCLDFTSNRSGVPDSIRGRTSDLSGRQRSVSSVETAPARANGRYRTSDAVLQPYGLIGYDAAGEACDEGHASPSNLSSIPCSHNFG